MDAWIKSYSNSKINYVADCTELLNSSGLEMDLSVIGLGKGFLDLQCLLIMG